MADSEILQERERRRRRHPSLGEGLTHERGTACQLRRLREDLRAGSQHQVSRSILHTSRLPFRLAMSSSASQRCSSVGYRVRECFCPAS